MTLALTPAYVECLQQPPMPLARKRVCRWEVEAAAERIDGLVAAIAWNGAHNNEDAVRLLAPQLTAAEQTLAHFESELEKLAT